MTDVHNDMMEDEDFDTVLSSNIDFTGTLNFEKSFLVRGKIAGIIDAQGILLIDDGAIVNADIKADRVIIRGSVRGNVVAAKRVEITTTGSLEGDINAPEVNIESGSIFNGHCLMQKITA